MSGPEDLVTAYAAAVDARDWVALADLFVEDGALITPDPPRSLEPVIASIGRDAIVATVRKVEGFAGTDHVVDSTHWQVDGSAASGLTIGQAHHHVDGPEPHSWVWYVEYRDDAVRTEAGWRFATRRLTLARIEKQPRP
ncbi:nuclear transport factor 2 family protein [Nocardioides marmorisolisilvae]|uniref:nuclear transport factor 2 family protein n=1 Tax=Nocardioides marmorisolisilvae TaxID=1542737 RepID=UPI00161A5C9A|nr:nuclear transport factor 2 family protein [Nocardioides marmorisolisilvae]